MLQHVAYSIKRIKYELGNKVESGRMNGQLIRKQAGHKSQNCVLRQPRVPSMFDSLEVKVLYPT